MHSIHIERQRQSRIHYWFESSENMTSQCKSTRNFKKASSKTSLEPPLHVEGNRWNYQKRTSGIDKQHGSGVRMWTAHGEGLRYSTSRTRPAKQKKKTVAIGVCRAMPSITSVGAERWLMVLRIIQTIPYNCKGLRRRESHFNVLVTQTRHFLGRGCGNGYFSDLGQKIDIFDSGL